MTSKTKEKYLELIQNKQLEILEAEKELKEKSEALEKQEKVFYAIQGESLGQQTDLMNLLDRLDKELKNLIIDSMVTE